MFAVNDNDSKTLNCVTCRAIVPLKTDDDSSLVVCPSCGENYGTWGEVKAEVIALLREQLRHERSAGR